MKFGKNIGVQQEARQDLHYVDYKLLKKLIKAVVDSKDNHEVAKALTANAAFEEQLATEIDEVNSCFSRCRHDLLERTAGIAELLKAEDHEGVTQPEGPATACAAGTSLDVCRPETFRSLVGILGEVDQLRKFAVWNAMAVVKILKKRRKQSNFGLADTFGERAGWLSRQTFFSTSDFAELHVAIKSVGDLLMHSKILPEDARGASLKQEAQQCPICFETISDMVELSCSHRFCWKCFVLGPIAHQPGEYRITQCPVCRKETTQNQVEVREGNEREVVGSSSEGLLLRFLHTYFPQEASSAEGVAWSEARKESEQMRGVVEEFVRAMLTDNDTAPSFSEGASEGRSSGSGAGRPAASVPSDFFQTLPPPSRMSQQQEMQVLGATQKLGWLQLVSSGDPLATDWTPQCFLCSESLLMETVATAPCKHQFHKTCINRINMPQCPICSADLPFSWFLTEDHPCMQRGFHVVRPQSYKPDFPGGPSRGSRGYPLSQPPPKSLFLPGGLAMNSYLHMVMPGAAEDYQSPNPSQPPSALSSPKRTAAESPEVTDIDDSASSTSQSSRESGSEDGLLASEALVWGPLGSMRLLQSEPGYLDKPAMPGAACSAAAPKEPMYSNTVAMSSSPIGDRQKVLLIDEFV